MAHWSLKEGKVPAGYGFWCNAWPENPAWKFAAVGLGNDVPCWTERSGSPVTLPGGAAHAWHG
ncbi:hypothetical protein GCM10010339_29670 [Streptomyces alanosinicus]|uniref:Uncharacterized protein n=1 Tax=Streptomyces alanosinicus TaxID=68171 RepID=A0A919D2C3_9ACTN|nr:hypothetical protein GCM10010339_29670 [Streptomyces alanosinicus]